MPTSADAQALLMLCSHLGLPSHAQPAPLTLREWNPLARKLAESALGSPAALLDTPAEALQSALDIPADLAERVARLAQRGASLAIELERMESLGIWAVTRADETYPAKLKQRLRESAPAVLFGAGDPSGANWAGLAVVGSRNIDVAGQACAESVGEACAASGLSVFSGGARGTDAKAMIACLEAGGKAGGVLADSLERAIRESQTREWLADGRLVLLSPYSPKAGFSVGAAMGRNKLIYALADYALVVSSDAETGGTWAGATEALRAEWVPVFVRDGDEIPEGNRRLLKRGAIPFPSRSPGHPSDLRDWLAEHAVAPPDRTSLFV